MRAAVAGWLAACGAAAAAAPVPSARSGMGAIPYADEGGTGTTFRVWAGTAGKVEVAGDFNGWGRTAMADEGNGIWSVDVQGARHGQEYKFILDGSNWRQDPRSVVVKSSSPEANSVIYDHSRFDWGGAERVVGGTDGTDCIWRNDLVVYEMHVGAFNAESGVPATFDEAIGKIPHLRRLGVSAVELMPVAEFKGDKSWGYNPSVLFAPESSYGGADGLKRFVKACHEAGMAVLVDVVHNHYGPDDLAIWQFDGTGPNGGMYFYDDDRRITDWGQTRPDYGNTNVAAFIRDQIFSLVEDYHVDGFRWDSVYNIAYTGNRSSTNEEGIALLKDINTRLYNQHPDVFRIAEDNALTSWEELEMGFEAQWHHGFLANIRALATAGDDGDRNMAVVAYYLSLYGGFHQVLYAESHDSCGELNEGKHRLPRDINGSTPQDRWAKKRAFLAHAVALTAPGIPMIFMGSEYNEDWDFSNNHALRWGDLAVRNDGIVSMFADLIALRRNSRGVTGAFREPENAVCTVLDDDRNVVVVARGGGLLLVFNWSADAYRPYEALAFPTKGTWHCLYNSDSTAYDRSFGGVGPAVGDTVAIGPDHLAAIPLGAYSLQIWGTSPLPRDAAVSCSPEVPAECAPVTLLYEPNDGVLAGATSVWVHVGFNGWNDAADIAMAPSSNLWTCEIAIPAGVWSMSVCFHDGNGLWDNHGGENWEMLVKIADDTPVPDFAITDPDPGAGPFDAGDAPSISVSGTAGNFAGGLLWSNAANGASGALRPGAVWTAGDIPLAAGTNLLRFAALNPNDGARDGDYRAFGNGVNGGSGFGPWQVDVPAANGGVFADASAGWGLWANSGATVDACRPFVHPLQLGDTLSFGFRRGLVESGGSVGFALCNALGQIALECSFDGGANEVILSAAATCVTAAPPSGAVQPVAFTLGPDWTCNLTVGNFSWSGNLRKTSVDRIASVRFWNHSAGAGSDHNLYVTSLGVDAENLFLAPALAHELAVVRAGASPVFRTAIAVTVSSDPETGSPVLCATLDADAPADLADAVWYAATLDSESGTWKWVPFPSDAVSVSGTTVVLRCPNWPFAVFSFGEPGKGSVTPL